MATDLIEVDQANPDTDVIDRAAQAIQAGQVVAVPTDALYTLIADPMNLMAVGKVFQAKGREGNRALPLFINGLFMAEELVSEWTSRLNLLSRRFWPGPLTVIVPATAKVPLRVTGNTGRLALRHSRSAIVQKLVDVLGHPLIGTSANISGSPTCRSGIEVFGTMDGRVDLVLDGGLCSGEGSTTVDITEPYWRVIKEGAVSERDLAEVLKGI